MKITIEGTLEEIADALRKLAQADDIKPILAPKPTREIQPWEAGDFTVQPWEPNINASSFKDVWHGDKRISPCRFERIS